MFWELFLSFETSERNTEISENYFDPVKVILKVRCQIYILMKRVINLRKIQVIMKAFAPPFFSHLSSTLNWKNVW